MRPSHLAAWLHSLAGSSSPELATAGGSVLQFPRPRLTHLCPGAHRILLHQPLSMQEHPSHLQLPACLQPALGIAQDNSDLTCLVLKRLSHTFFVLMTSSGGRGPLNPALCHAASCLALVFPVTDPLCPHFKEAHFKAL